MFTMSTRSLASCWTFNGAHKLINTLCRTPSSRLKPFNRDYSKMPTPGHEYPGVNFALAERLDYFDIGSHYPIGFAEYPGGQSTIMHVKEVAMMILMDTLTDKSDWHKKVFDEFIVQKWREEARQQSEEGLYTRIMQDKLAEGPSKPQSRILTDAAFDYCIQELRSKANYFVNSGLIPTLDGPCNTAVKSDSCIKESLRQELKNAFDILLQDQGKSVDWHPRSNDMVQDLIHPSMYHFVYDRSPFIQEEVVGVESAISFMGQGGPVKGQTPPEMPSHHINTGYGTGSGKVYPEYWSCKYQWLPANVCFRKDGSARFTSYVNNLHPAKYPDIYRTLEHIIDKAIPAWDQCLREGTSSGDQKFAGRKNSRFKWIDETNDEEDDLWEPKFDAERFKTKDDQPTHESLGDPNHPLSTPGDDKDEEIARERWWEVRQAKLPDPLPFEPVNYAPKQSLREKFEESGLQVIIKMASIELTPEKSEFAAGSWHLEGQMNEKIAATALYYVDAENITPSRLSFRVQTSSYLQDDIITEQDQYDYLERVFGTLLSGWSGPAGSCNQSYGDIETKEGRILAFSNVFQHRVSSFRLQDPTKPGHRRFVALWLIDPHRRIISTANVPPQQKHWLTGDDPDREILKGLMTDEEAKRHRLGLMDERTADTAREHWESLDYGFCEH